jgi:TRAP transporter 4TM/12TM fusion protein
MALISTVLLSQIRRETRMGIKDILNALNYGGRNILTVGIACVVCGIIVGVIAMTGVGQAIGYNILLLSKNILFFVLFFTMVTSIFLSMGLPATACYIIVASVCAPALMQIGILPIVAHFFVFYFGCLSNLTPPVCLASFTAAAIAGANPSKVAWTGLRLVFASFIIPYVFVYSPQLLLQEMDTLKFIVVLGSTFLAVISFVIAERGFLFEFLKIWERVLFFLTSLLLIIPGSISSSIGLFSFIIVFYVHKKGIKIIG